MRKTSRLIIYTIGHSNYESYQFIKILHSHSIETIVDVRSAPYSKYCPQFNMDTIKQALNNSGIEYLFLGKELGARPKEQDCYVGGKVSFEKLRESEFFKKGMLQLLDETEKHNIAIMCSEKEPIDCHRAILISRVLTQQGVTVKHILSEKELMEHKDLEEQLLKKCKVEETLFDTESSKQLNLQEAYQKQEKMISYQEAVLDGMV
jgi:uncharacterized protein (DUF488 family)